LIEPDGVAGAALGDGDAGRTLDEATGEEDAMGFVLAAGAGAGVVTGRGAGVCQSSGCTSVSPVTAS
jgi:hypothetical protein